MHDVFAPRQKTTTQSSKPKNAFPQNTTIFSRFPLQWKQHANLQPASLWSLKGYLRWIIYDHTAVVLNPVKSTKNHNYNVELGQTHENQVWALWEALTVLLPHLPSSLCVSAKDKRGGHEVSLFDVHSLLMICLAFAAVTQHSAPPIDMVMNYMFMLTCIFSFQRGNNKCMRRAQHLKIGHCC